MSAYSFRKQRVSSKLLLGLKSISICVISSVLILLVTPTHIAFTQELPIFETTINSLAWHPDSTMIALGLEDGTCVILDAQSQELEFSAIVGTWSVRAVAWNSSGERFAAGNSDGTLMAWAMPEQQLLYTWKETWKRGFGSVIWTPQGDHVISVIGSESTDLGVWDAATGELLVESHLPNIGDFAWSPDGSKLAVANFIGAVWIVDSETFRRETYFTTGNVTSFVKTIAWSPDGESVAAGSIDGSVRIWNYSTGELVSLFDGNEGDINSRTLGTGLTPDSNILHIAFSPDSSRLGSVSTDGTVRMWATDTGQVVFDGHIAEEDERISAAAWSPDGTQLAYGVRKSLDSRESHLEVISLSLGQNE